MRILIGSALLAFCASGLAQERLFANHVDNRTVITFRAPDAAVQKMLPEGWEINAPASGPGKGANLALVLIEQLIVLDAQGAPVEPARGAVLTIPARKKGSDAAGSMVVAGLFTGKGAPGAYGVYLPATVNLERRQRVDGDGKILIEERWSAKGPDGHWIEAQVQFARGPTARTKSESKAYSGARPDFYRIYRAETVSDVVRGAETTDVSAVSVSVGGQKYTPLLGGSQKIVSVTSIPSFVRAIYLPGP